jgi:hypothetical protein
MMASTKDTTISLREAIDALVTPEVMGPLDELAEVLLMISGTVARLRRKLDPQGTSGADLLMLDQSFSRSIVLTRALRERLQVRRGRGEYASVSHVAREVVGRLHGVVAGTMSVCLECPAGPAIVAADRSDVRRLLAGMLEIGIEAAHQGGTGRVDLDISEVQGPSGERRRRVVLVELRTAGTVAEGNVRLAGSVRPLVRALGGTMTIREVLRGGTAISVRLPCAC